MSKKYCQKCYLPVEMTDLECPSCITSIFIHSLPDQNMCHCKLPLISGSGGICDICSKEISPARIHLLAPKSATTQTIRQTHENTNKSVNLVKESLKMSDDISLDDLRIFLDDLIRAQNRTTYAVRAFVRFLFIQLIGTTIAIVLWNTSTAFIDSQECSAYATNCSGNTFLQFLAAAVMIGSIIWSSQAGWEELGKSNID